MIRCRWLKEHLLLINPDGQAWPCCYFANTAFKGKILNLYDEWTDHHIFQEYDKHKKELNIFNNTLQKIVEHEWYTKTLPESWNSQKTCHSICKETCSYNTKENKYYD
jgi:hypothetical protein